MQAQQLLDYIIKPTLEYMGGNYNSKNARMLILATAAIESDCGYYIKQINGPALGVWQMEPDTESDIHHNCDAYHDSFKDRIDDLIVKIYADADLDLMTSPTYACAMARLKYSMDPEPLPEHDDIYKIFQFFLVNMY